ncbi:MAG TPA: DUF1810 domain-containing protein [Terracidiphilus sp.]|nr:DUF1810 domain-containing protein [Terracidiphilus sp.]
MEDTFDLARFLSAQAGVYPQVLAELGAGQKRSHWIWFIFPQMKGLGVSSHSQFYGIGSLEEAKAYWHHPVLGPRLEECAILVNQVQKTPIERILGSPDDLKFRSSMTLFSRAARDSAVFTQALDKYFGGKPDLLTLELLG